MPYNITLTNGTNLVTVADGTTDSTTSLKLIGKNFAGYGQFLNKNFVQLLENFANNTQPANALQGQLWWDTTNNALKIYNGSLWKSVSGTTSSLTQPLNAISGDQWWDTSNGQLKVWNGASWVVIGPSYTATQGQTGVVANAVADTSLGTHIIVEFYVQTVLVAILSKDPAFTVNTLDPGFSTINPGFSTINPGFNLSSAVANIKYSGNADNALNLNGTSNYLRNDIPGTLVGNLTVTSDIGVTIGSTSALNISANTSAVNVSSITSGKDLIFSTNVGGNQTILLTLNGATGNITVPNIGASSAGESIANKNYVTDTLVSGTSLQRDGSNTITGNITPASNSLDFGSISSTFGNIYATNFVGTATNALSLSGVNTYARTDVTPIFAVPVIINNSAIPTQLTVGSGNDFSIGVTASPNAVNLTNNNTGKNLTMQVTVGGILTTILTANATTGGTSVSGTLSIASTAASTSTTTGALLVSGGTGIAGNINVGGSAVVNSTIASTSYTTGALLVSGGVGIGGALNVAGDVTAFATSDLRLKTNIEIIPDAVNKVMNIRGITYNWNSAAIDKSLTDTEVGVIAQEVFEVLPEVVTTRSDGFLAVRYERIIPLLIEAIKELKAEIDVLKGK